MPKTCLRELKVCMKDLVFNLFIRLVMILVCEKRLSAGWFTYSLIEIMQRYHISGPVHFNIDMALEHYHLQIRENFYRVWSQHSCDVRIYFIIIICVVWLVLPESKFVCYLETWMWLGPSC